jgi:hypothetical protein
MPSGILKFPRARYAPPAGCLFYLPFNRMGIGASPNLVTNPSFETGGTPPADWTLVGSACVQSQDHTENSANQAKLTRAGFDAYIYQNAAAYASILKGINVTLAGKAWTATGNQTKLGIYDGVSTDPSSYHTGGSTWETLSLIKRIAYNGNKIWSCCMNYNTNGACYFDTLMTMAPYAKELSKNGYAIYPDCTRFDTKGAFFDGTDTPVNGGDDLISFGQSIMPATGNTLLLMGWFKASTAGYGSAGKIISDGKISLRYVSGNNALAFSSDGQTHEAQSADNSVGLNKWYHFAVIRNADGSAATIYTNGVNAMSGGTPQNSGAIAAGTTNTIIGNNLSAQGATQRTWGGYLDELAAVVNGVNDTAEIKRHYAMTCRS